ncbi:hypothetical protein CPLU01_09474 [Colletotrichum plurivorum]|uniref:Uncharacterized protein n=1 Tax=Colletotrichum plurivorum TaxID=2175906 RepID=A0A8H6K988_9PEZI|nr:hypothetical protein CPLU01_09474 [Colletotrichum plurivorum]
MPHAHDSSTTSGSSAAAFVEPSQIPRDTPQEQCKLWQLLQAIESFLGCVRHDTGTDVLDIKLSSINHFASRSNASPSSSFARIRYS